MTVIRVASGLAVRGEKILMGKRKEWKIKGTDSAPYLRPGLWELPGGKVEFGERAEDALCREWREELGVTLSLSDVGNLLDVAVIHAEVSFAVELYPVVLRHDSGAQPVDHSELRWVDPTEAVMYLPCSPAFYLQYRSILSWSKP